MVLAVMTLLVALTVPALRTSSATRLSSGGRIVASMTTTARQTAMANNTLAALILLTDHGSDHDYRSLAVIYYKEGQGWLQKGSWEPLPEGVIADFGNPGDCTFLNASPSPFPFLTDNAAIKYQGAALESGRSFAARVFLPSGGLLDSSIPSQIRLVEGHVENGTLRYSHPGTGGSSDNYFDIAIVGATGLPKISRPQL